jgi:hypothetical protein
LGLELIPVHVQSQNTLSGTAPSLAAYGGFVWGSSLRVRAMANYIEDLSGVLQGLGAAAIALLVLPVLITALVRSVTLALSASLLSLASFMLFVAPASASSGLAILSGLGSFVVAVESIVARRRMVTLNNGIADLTSRVNQLENAEQRRLALEIKRKRRNGGASRSPHRHAPVPDAEQELSALRPSHDETRAIATAPGDGRLDQETLSRKL